METEDRPISCKPSKILSASASVMPRSCTLARVVMSAQPETRDKPFRLKALNG